MRPATPAAGRWLGGAFTLGIITAVMSVGLMAAGCDGEDTTGPEPGTLEVTLSSPHTDDAAVLITVDGPGIEAVESGVDIEGYMHLVEDGTARTVVLVAEALGPSVVLRVSVPDVGAVDRYTATLIQAADTANAVRASLDGYAVTVREPGG